MGYDKRGLRTTLIDPDLSNAQASATCSVPADCPWTYGYDMNGRLTDQTDSAGNTVSMTYDELGRILTKDYPTDTDISWEYDTAASGLGLLTKVTRGANHESSYTYDAWQRTDSITTRVHSSTRTTQMAYDLASRITTLTYPTAEDAVYTYTASGPETLTFAGSNIVTGASYDAFGRPTQIDWGNGLSTTRTWGVDEKTERIRVSGASDLLDLNYEYDAGGNATQIIEAVTDWRREYDYDWAERLLEGRHKTDSSGALLKTWTYQYAPLGNMTYNSEWDVGGGEDGSYSYGAAGPHAVTTIGASQVLSYDVRGNLLSEQLGTDPAITYTWNEGGLLATTSDPNQPVNPNLALEYDGLGDRVRKTWTVDDGQSGTETREIRYFGDHFEEYIEGAAMHTERYVSFGGRAAYVTDQHPGKIYFLHPDVQGTVDLVTDESAAVVDRKIFGPYGDLYSAAGSSGLHYGYTGEEHDSEVGLVHLGVREHHPMLARFTSPDALIGRPHNPQSFNRYSYARNNPVRYIDPSGYTPGVFNPNPTPNPDDVRGEAPPGQITVRASRDQMNHFSEYPYGDVWDNWLHGAEQFGGHRKHGILLAAVMPRRGRAPRPEDFWLPDLVAEHLTKGFHDGLRPGEYKYLVLPMLEGGRAFEALMHDITLLDGGITLQGAGILIVGGLPSVVGAGEAISAEAVADAEAGPAEADLTKLTNRELNQRIGSEGRKALGELWGSGRKGAEAGLEALEQGRSLPEGLTRTQLEAYEEISQRTIAEGLDKQGTQAIRLQIVRMALGRL